MVDDAHGGGVLGPQGRGTAAHCCLTIRNLIQMGTLGKALGVEGGYIAGSRALIDLLTNAARSFIFSTAPSPANAAAALAAVRIVAEADDRRGRLMTSSTTLRSALRNLGYAAPDGLGPIVPVVLGDARQAVALSERLLLAGVWTPAIRPPTVPEGTARLRISLSAAHTPADIEAAIDAFARSRSS
jgi:7-keto-8-aminopelargonate synthetase-like enzyme